MRIELQQLKGAYLCFSVFMGLIKGGSKITVQADLFRYRGKDFDSIISHRANASSLKGRRHLFQAAFQETKFNNAEDANVSLLRNYL